MSVIEVSGSQAVEDVRNMDASNFVLSGDFGYVVLVMIFSVFVLMWMGFKVGAARKKYEVHVSIYTLHIHVPETSH